jgi:alternate signal-mediated exported protein
MNKTTKAAVATATGIVLLMGGAGSLAYWDSSANTGNGSSQTISAGTLNITAANSGSWTKGLYDNSNAVKVAPAAVADITTVKIVPGNRLVYTQTFNVTATGNDLFFTVTPTNGTLGATTNGLAGRLTSTFTVDSTGLVTSSIGNSTTAGTYKVTGAGATGTGTITVTWTINWPFGDSTSVTADNAAKLGTVLLNQGAVTLTQVANP